MKMQREMNKIYFLYFRKSIFFEVWAVQILTRQKWGYRTILQRPYTFVKKRVYYNNILPKKKYASKSAHRILIIFNDHFVYEKKSFGI